MSEISEKKERITMSKYRMTKFHRDMNKARRIKMENSQWLVPAAAAILRGSSLDSNRQ